MSDLSSNKDLDKTLFDPVWLECNTEKAKAVIDKLRIEDQARYLSQLPGKIKLDFLNLSSKSKQVVQALAPEEVYYMVKEIGVSDCLPVLSALTGEQMQYFFDLELWTKDRFVPQRAVEWIVIMGQCNAKKLLDWFLQEDIDQVVTLLKGLVLVYKKDEMTDSYAGIEGLKHYSPDGVYDIFFLDSKAFEPLLPIFKLLRGQYPETFFNVMEGAIWHSRDSVEESAYRWRISRTSSRGIPDFEEAFEIYSRLDPDAIKELPVSETDFFEDDYINPPTYIIENMNPGNFFSKCWALLKSEERQKAIRWELVYLANKLMVADGLDSGKFENHRRVISKSLAFVNIGLELAAQGDVQKGATILSQSWAQPIFQVGYGHLLNLKKKGTELVKDGGIFLDRLISDVDRDILSSLTVFPIPMIKSRVVGKESLLKDFESLDEVEQTLNFLKKLTFFRRLAKQCLGVSDSVFESIFKARGDEEKSEEISFQALTATALARFILFEEISCEPLSSSAAQSFLKLILIPRVPSVPGEPVQVCDDEKLMNFYAVLLDGPLAWSEEDREFLGDLLAQVMQDLEIQFSMINLKKPIHWEHVDILIVNLVSK
jgi:hypothetical protein